MHMNDGRAHKIAVMGPESSGKSTLCIALATHYGCAWVPEYARAYLEARGGVYTEEALLRIADGQCAAEDAAMREARHAQSPVICDSDMITLRIWSEEKYGRCDPRIRALCEERHYDHWLLCMPDLPWIADPLRENPHDRDRLFDRYVDVLTELGKPYSVVHGSMAQGRLLTAVQAVDRVLGRSPATTG